MAEKKPTGKGGAGKSPVSQVEPIVEKAAARKAHAYQDFLPAEHQPFKGLSEEGLASENIAPKVKQFDEAFEAVAKKHSGAFEAVKTAQSNLEKTQDKIKACYVMKGDKPVEEAGKPKIQAAKKVLHDRLETQLNAQTKTLAEKQGALKEILTAGDKASEEVKKFAEVTKTAKKLQSNLTGQYHAHGALGAVKSNFTLKSPGNSWGKIAFHGAATVVGGGMLLDAFRSKTSDGQDRSWVTRVGEGALGTAAIAGGLMGGKARI